MTTHTQRRPFLFSAYARRHPGRALFLVALVIVLADWSADDGCDCNPQDVAGRSVAVAGRLR